MKKRALSLLLALVLCLGLLPMTALAAPSSGSYDGITWEFDESSGKLTVSGSGELQSHNYHKGNADHVGYDWWQYDFQLDIKSVVIEEGITCIGREAFEYCPSLTDVTIADSVTKIESQAFQDCINLTRIDLGSGLTEIKSNAFENCTSLRSIVLPDSLVKMDLFTFRGCTSLQSVELGDNVEYLGADTFRDCTSLTSFRLPERGGGDASSCFRDSGLTEVTIPAGIRADRGDISMILWGCDTLTDVYYEGTEEQWKALGGSEQDALARAVKHFSGGQTSGGDGCAMTDGVVTGYTGKGGAVTIPDNATEIAMNAFKNNTAITSVVIPASVKKVGDYAFEGCTGLTSVTILGADTLLGLYSFGKCTSLSHVELPAGIYMYGNGVFRECTSLTEITIPAGSTVDPYTFSAGYSSVSGLKHLIIAGNCAITRDGTWYNLTDVTFQYGCTAVPYASFTHADDLTTVTLADSVKEIGSVAFMGCGKLNQVNLGNGLTTIHDKAFEYCEGLTELTIPASVTSIAANAFNNSGLKTIRGVPGSYAQTFAQSKGLNFVAADGSAPEKPTEPQQPAASLAKAGNQDIEIDGTKVAFQTYMLADANGNGTNYVKLRDIAHVLNGTGAQFSVGYNRQEQSISAATGEAYKDTGTEMDTPFAGADKEYIQSNLTIVVDGAPVQLDAITLMDDAGNGYNYFKLRDLGDALGFTVGYSRARGVYVETK